MLLSSEWEIGNGSIIASRSVVTHDIAAYSIVGGNPAVVIKRRYSEEDIDLLERVVWWDCPIEKIIDNLPIIASGTVGQLCECS